MKKNGFTLIELLSVIVILSVISAIAYPKVLDVISSTKISAYNSAKGNIIQSAKLKYLADVGSSIITEYNVDELIDEGYLKNTTKNPITNEKYENTKIIITNEKGKITYDYIEGNTLFDVVSKKINKDGIYTVNNNYIYKGINAKNYVSFNEDIYRIIKIDEFRNVYLLKSENNELIKKDDIEKYINIYYNDNYSELLKKEISSVDVLDYNDYLYTFENNNTFIQNNNDIWVKKDNNFTTLSYINNELVDSNTSTIRLVIKLNSNLVVLDGDGSNVSPYLITKSN